MIIPSKEIKQKRKEFIQQVFDKIRNVPEYSDFYTHSFYVFASLGLFLKAKEEKFFENKDWNNLECREELLNEIYTFLKKYIR